MGKALFELSLEAFLQLRREGEAIEKDFWCQLRNKRTVRVNQQNRPREFADEVKANRVKNASQWETFTKYLESKGKLR